MRRLKKDLLKFLEQDDFENKQDVIHDFPPLKIVNSLFPFLCSTDPVIKKNAAKAMGEVVARLAENNIESARVIMRRLMLNLNDESGGIGWGAPLAMGEIMSRSTKLADEYYKILISYAKGGGNHLDFEELQKDVIAGLKRLKDAYPHLVKEFPPELIKDIKQNH